MLSLPNFDNRLVLTLALAIGAAYRQLKDIHDKISSPSFNNTTSYPTYQLISVIDLNLADLDDLQDEIEQGLIAQGRGLEAELFVKMIEEIDRYVRKGNDAS